MGSWSTFPNKGEFIFIMILAAVGFVTLLFGSIALVGFLTTHLHWV